MTTTTHALARSGGSILFSFVLVALVSLAAWPPRTATAATQVMEYGADKVGNITSAKRALPPGVAVTNFDPASGPVGTAVTITGSGFSATPASNLVKFNGTTAAVNTATPTSLSVTVPSGATTGAISVTVAGLTGNSVGGFTVTQPGAPTITGFTPDRGISGTQVTVTGTNFDLSPGATTAKLGASTLVPVLSSATQISFVVPSNAGSAPITVTTPAGSATSTTAFIVPPSGYAAEDIVSAAHLTPDAGALPLSVFAHNKHAIVTFEGVQNGYYTLVMANLLTSPTLSTVTYKIHRPDNTLLATGSLNQTIPAIFLPKLPAAGVYSIVLSPGAATLTADARVVADRTVPIDGAAQAFSAAAPDQRVRMVLPLVTGQNVSLGIANLTHTSGTGTHTVNVYKPDGTLFATNGCNATGTVPGCRLGLNNPPVTGDYIMEMIVATGVMVNFNASLSTEVQASLTLGTPLNVSLARPGQTARLTFAGTAGSSLGVEFAALITTSPHSYAASVYRPDGTLLASANPSAPSGALINLANLPTTGTYTITLVPTAPIVGGAQVTVESGPTLTDTSASQAFSAAVTGETARMIFSGTAGQNLTLALTGISSPDTGSATSSLNVYRPDGNLIGSAPCNASMPGGSCRFALTNLPSTGTYSATIVGTSGIRISANATLSSDLTGTLTAGTPLAVSLTRAGQAARLTFAGTAGNSLGIELAGVTVNVANQTYSFSVLKPDGSTLASGTTAAASSGGFANLANLPATGNYTLSITPTYGITSTMQVTLDAGAALAIDGASQAFSMSLAGETARFTFAGTSGQLLSVGLAGLIYLDASPYPSTLSVLKPDGTSLGTASCGPTAPGGGCRLTLPALPSTGTYAVTLAPPNGVRASGTATLSTPAVGTFTIGGGAATVTITRTGQVARYTFSGTSGQLLRLNWSGTSVTPATSVTVAVLKPDGSQLTASSFAHNATGGVDIPSLPVTGTYTVSFEPNAGATVSAPVSLVTR